MIVGTGAKVLGGVVNIGDNVIIGALSFINCDVPANHTAYGIPPNRVIKLTENSAARQIT